MVNATRLVASVSLVVGLGAIASACASSGYDAAYDCAQAEVCDPSAFPADCVRTSEALYEHLRDDERDLADLVFSTCRELEGCDFVDCACHGVGGTTGVCAVARCRDLTKSCADFGVDDCPTENGCHLVGACEGQATAVCETLGLPTTCEANGCSWGNGCSGTPSCPYDPTEVTCDAAQGCHWKLTCEGDWRCTG